MTQKAKAAVELKFRCMEHTEDDLQRFIAAFARDGSERTPQHLRWQYFDNPTGRLNVELALTPDESRIAAIVSLMPVAMKVGDQVLPGCQALDTLTDVDFRGQGLFGRLGKTAIERSTKEGYACVWGFPNASAAPGWFGRLGWTRMNPVPFLIKPLRLNYALRRAGPLEKLAARLPGIPMTLARAPRLPASQELRNPVEFTPEYDALWKAFAASIPVAVERDARYLTWRLARKPKENYQRLALYENGALRGFVAWAVKDKHGGRVGYVMELLHAPDAPEVGRALLAHAICEMNGDGAEVVLAWNFAHSPNHAAYRALGFFTLPERLRPIELHFGARTLAAPDSANICNRSNWYLSYLDSDTV